MQQQAEQSQPPAPPGAEGIGSLLRRARQRRRSSLDDASRETRISVTYLSALEAGAPLSAFPAPVYARGFLREYARYLGLDPEPLVDRFWEGDAVPDPVVMNASAAAMHGANQPRGLRTGLRHRTR